MESPIMKSIASLACLVLLGAASLVLADPPGGPIKGISRVPGSAVNVHKILYRGGEQADFAIRGDGTTTLNLVVRDEAGNVIVSTVGPGDRAHVAWRPIRTGYFYVSVVNSGIVFNDYEYLAY
jgi:hypothetical protein